MNTQQTEQQDKPPATSRWLTPRQVTRQQYLWLVALFTLLGVIGGYTYYALVGCNTGTCAITSNPYISMAWGGLLGYLLHDVFIKK